MLKRLRKAAAPLLLVLAIVLVCAVPWGLRVAVEFVFPLSAAMAIFLLALQPNVPLPAAVVFAAGLIVDLLTGGPLGYWALLFLAAHGIGRALPMEEPLHLSLLWAGYMLVALTVAAIGWAVASAYYVRVIDWHPLLIAVACAGALFPIFSRVTGHKRKRRLWARP
jgi:rod shape-determining protein MreD